MSSQNVFVPPVQEEIISLSRDDFEELCRLASPAPNIAPDQSLSTVASSSVKQVFVRPGLQKQFEFNSEVLSLLAPVMMHPPDEHPEKAILKKVLSVLTQRNELLVVADKDPGIWEFYDQRTKAESLKVSNPILAEYFKEKKKEDKKAVSNFASYKRSFHPYSDRGRGVTVTPQRRFYVLF